MTPNDTLLSVEDLKVYFRNDEELARAVDGISFDVRREETVCLVGESGCGKTVTALSILRVKSPAVGSCSTGKISLISRRRRFKKSGGDTSPWSSRNR